ncbi:Protease HtpX [bioreactor metagenome]|uniref:Protease HtpX n=1 Tax=bioreactor metagenome TaxID=1076179 RepID=A0A644ZJH4_9ZZZZ
MEQTIFILIVAFLLLDVVVGTWLSLLNSRHWPENVPERIASVFTQKKFLKARSYSHERRRLSYVVSFFQLALILIMLFSGGFARIDDLAGGIWNHRIGQSIVYFGIIFLAVDVLTLPFQWYSVFSIEQKFGFNKSTPAIFIGDKIKSWIMAAVLGGGIFWLLAEIYYSIPDYFWLLAWGVLTLFSLLMTMFYSNIIVPLFNKQTPLEAGELRDAIELFAKTNGFNLKNIFVINGSKRSTKSNAYFTGIGPKKRIVLYDTLIEKHTTDEIVAVLAHEIGHYKMKHVTSGFIFSTILNLGALYLLNLFLSMPEFAGAIGMKPSLHASLLVFALLFSPVSTIIGVVSNIISRRHEFAADRFAYDHTHTPALADALIKLSVDNLSNPTPHPYYVFVNYSHPPVLERLDALDRLSEKDKN